MEGVWEKSDVINNYIQNTISTEIFSLLKYREDEKKDIYIFTQNILSTMRDISGAQCLYVARLNEEEKPVYIVDGCNVEDKNFHHLGDSVEPELIPPIQQCVSGESVESQGIISSRAGKIFVACHPLKDSEGNNLGALVMGFDARGFVQRHAANGLWALALCVLFAICLFGLVAYFLCKQLVQPLKRIEKAAVLLPQGDFEKRVPEDATVPEIRRLQEALNVMASRISASLADIKENERARTRAEEATQAKSEFLANMSHDIRTPMNGVLGMLHLALGQEMSRSCRSYLVKAEKSARGLLGLLNDILDFSKIEAKMLTLESAPFCLRSVLEDVIDLQRAHINPAKVALEWKVDPQLPEVFEGDALRIHQILNNLVSNAVKFTSEGSVRLEIMLDRMQGEYALVKIRASDTGIGMTLEQVKRLYTPFTQADSSTTRRYGGTGIGLTITKRIVEMMQGDIAVESCPGQGTTFSLRLALKVIPNLTCSDTTQMENCDTAFLRGMRILVAEDNEINQEIVKELLSLQGCAVSLANNGLEAVEMVRVRTFDLVLMDIQMPNMDGLQATKAIRKSKSAGELPIVAMTAHALEQDYAKSRAAGMQDHITKPIVPAYLFRVIERVMIRKKS